MAFFVEHLRAFDYKSPPAVGVKNDSWKASNCIEWLIGDLPQCRGHPGWQSGSTSRHATRTMVDHGWKGCRTQNTKTQNLENGKNRKNRKITRTFQQHLLKRRYNLEQGVGNWRFSIALDLSDIAGKWH